MTLLPTGAHPVPVDVSLVPELSGLFAPTTAERDIGPLEVVGELPPELDGTYLRNGPNPRFTPIGSYTYPLDGDGMIHAVRIDDGRVSYSNRFVETPALRAEERAGHALWSGLMTMYRPDATEVGAGLAGTRKDLPDINVVRHAGRTLALAEAAPPFALSPELATLGRETFGGALPAGITAHPKIDPRTGELLVFCYGIEAPFLTWSVVGPDGTIRRTPTVVDGVERPTMIHDMAITDRFVVLVVAPYYFDIAAAMSGGSLLTWRPEDGTRIALVPRDGSPTRWLATDAFWCWHLANAFDDGPAPGGAGGAGPGPDGAVVVDYVQWDRPGTDDPADEQHAMLVRARLDLGRGTVVRTPAHDRRVEFPRIDDRVLGRRHDRVATIATRPDDPQLADTLVVTDLAGGHDAHWRAPELALGEPVHLPRPGDPDPGHGWWATLAVDRREDVSWFLVLPADDPAAGPVARVRIPVRVPLGLHGVWLPSNR
ncbi:9-cis-epoxycarotenoid dioxygenase [Pseudonocardia dioxanivorans CB1190]|uniref:Dioxygenase n=1 Tax=Pseudonocardia dioxanivorans (strain ATCC 55486 / DSM 44775 / JCM 13855 / CB1190) TaxID=675635 RepID=F4CW64_PSEUX|nr:carotenoid oxygenase family protein [Pseudonocardia dioxanivorans]AEA26478.1 9-cis-epoxycarotenoid dioxygenase [Pseudonocardia dioxanivorans CB1190]